MNNLFGLHVLVYLLLFFQWFRRVVVACAQENVFSRCDFFYLAIRSNIQAKSALMFGVNFMALYQFTTSFKLVKPIRQ